MRFPLLFLVALLASGCSNIAHLLNRRIDLEVLSALQMRTLGGLPGGSGIQSEEGEYYLALSVQVSNPAWREDFAVPYTSFSLATASGLELAPSAESAQLTEACDGTVTLTKGASLSCTVVFEVPDNDPPVELIFLTPEERKGKVDIELVPCTWCGLYCVDTDTDLDHCGGCDMPVDSDQACEDGAPVCIEQGEALCGEQCADLQTDPTHCGACFEGVPPGHICEGGAPACLDPETSSCADGCWDLWDDDENCGECGRDCGDGDCDRGNRCTDYTQTSDENAVCDDVCAAQGYTCDYVIAYYSSTCYAGYDELSIGCDELPPHSSGYCYYHYVTGCFCELVF